MVAGAAARGQSVRAVGSGHSFTDIACTEGVLVDLSRYAAAARRRLGVRAGHRRGRREAARARGDAGRARARAREPGRHRRPGDRGRARDRDARNRRQVPEPRRPRARDAARRSRGRCAGDRRLRPRAPAGRACLAWRPRDRVRGDAPGDPDLHASPPRRAAAADRDARAARRARRGKRPLRVLRLPVHGDRADQIHPAKRGAARPDTRVAAPDSGGRDREPGALADLPSWPFAPAVGATAQPADDGGDVGVARPGSRLPCLRDDAQCPLHGDGVRDPARAWARGGRAGAGR